MYKVFVYGTLKTGFPNNDINTGRHVGPFMTKHRYPLFLVGDRFSPWLILDEGKGHSVAGEVFQVDESALQNMDKLERITEKDGYKKVEIPVVPVDSNEEMLALVYVKSIDQLKEVELRSEALAEYGLEHAALYRRSGF